MFSIRSFTVAAIRATTPTAKVGLTLSMAEIASAYPTAGGLYYWSSKLGSAAWGWFTGWFNLVGQIAVTASIDYGAAIFTTALLNLWFPDSIGTDAYNQKLSERRAAAVKAYLVSKGIPASKVTTIGKGETQPVATNKTAEGRQKNRRVDMVLPDLLM